MAGALDRLLHPTDQARVLNAVKAAERLSSGEIKVHVEARCRGGDAPARAGELFRALGLQRTEKRNAVLIYLAVRDQLFALHADSGIAADAAFFEGASRALANGLKRSAFGDGLVGAVQAIGHKLAARFPRAADDRNAIDNEITTDENAT
jgi:uncharacterized membrane protein